MSRSDLEAVYAPIDADVEPEDAYNISYISFLMLGFSLLVPWNAVISSLDFWNQTFPGHAMGTVYSVAFQSPSLIGLALVTLYGSRFSFRARIVPLFAVMAVALGLMPFLTSFDITIVLAIIIGFVGTMASGSVFGMAAMFAPRHISAVMTGQGVAGLLVALLRMLFKVCFSNDKAGTDTATYVYFGIAVLVIVIGIALFIFALEPSPVTAFYLKRAESAASQHARVNSTEDESGHAVVVPSPMRADASQYQPLHDPASPDELNQELSMWATVRNMSIAVFGVFWVTLALFPGITSQIQSTHPSMNDHSDTNPTGTGWFGIIMVFVFCLGDLLGRWSVKWQALVVVGPTGVLLSSVLRLAFFPLFAMLVKKTIVGDHWAYLIMLIFSFTNGYFATLSLMFASDAVPAQHKQYVGLVTVVALTVGLTAGVWTGVAIQHVVGN